MTTLLILGALLLLSLVVTLHELGHFFAMKLCGIPVAVFSVGMGPTLWSRRIGATLYRLGALPLGGYVRPVSEAELQDRESDEPKQLHSHQRSLFEHAEPWKRLVVAAAGPVTNLALGVVCAFGFASSIERLPVSGPPTVSIVETGSMAESVGMRAGDRLLEVNGRPLQGPPDAVLGVYTSFIRGRLNMLLSRHGELLRVEADLPKWNTCGTAPKLGVTLHPAGLINSPHFADRAEYALRLTTSQFACQFDFLHGLLSGERSLREMSGPVGIVSTIATSIPDGWLRILNVLLLLNLALAFMNLLPIPLLDGGHILLSIIEGASRRRLPHQAQLVIQLVGLGLMFALFATTTTNDILRLLS